MEEKLREAACFGDLDALNTLLTSGADVNSRHKINGWTALHWAAKRNNPHAIGILLDQGADSAIKNCKGETPQQLTSDLKIRKLLGGGRDTIPEENEVTKSD